MYDNRLADVYNQIYAAAGKDYAAEAAAVSDLIGHRNPRCGQCAGCGLRHQ